MVKIGGDSIIGRIATLADGLDSGETTLAKEMNHLIHMLLVAAALSGATFFAVSFGLGYDWLTAILFLIGILVANVPEGLVCVATVSNGSVL